MITHVKVIPENFPERICPVGVVEIYQEINSFNKKIEYFVMTTDKILSITLEEYNRLQDILLKEY